MRSRLFGGMLALGLLAALALAGCGGSTAVAGSSSTSTQNTRGSGSNTATVHTKTLNVNGKSMTVLADVNGKTLYYFKPDTASKATCTASCASLWPPLMMSSGLPTSKDTLPGTLAVLSGANGSQVLYNGHPLYTYSKDEDAGDFYGNGIAGQWFLATPNVAVQSSSSSSNYSVPNY